MEYGKDPRNLQEIKMKELILYLDYLEKKRVIKKNSKL
jgi:hypothetical protein